MIRVLIIFSVILALGVGIYTQRRGSPPDLSSINAIINPQLPLLGFQRLDEGQLWGNYYILTMPTGERVLMVFSHGGNAVALTPLPPLPAEKP